MTLAYQLAALWALTADNRTPLYTYTGYKYILLHIRVGRKCQKLTNHLGDGKVYCVWAYFCHKNCFQTAKKVFDPLGLRLKIGPETPKPPKNGHWDKMRY